MFSFCVSRNIGETKKKVLNKYILKTIIIQVRGGGFDD